jgi:hypothetical protein
MRRLGAGLPGSRVRLSPMPVYEGENNQARHQLTLRKELLCGPVQLGKHVPLGVSLVARFNVTFICDSCGRQPHVTHHRKLTIVTVWITTYGSLDGEITEC